MQRRQEEVRKQQAKRMREEQARMWGLKRGVVREESESEGEVERWKKVKGKGQEKEAWRSQRMSQRVQRCWMQVWRRTWSKRR